MKIIETIDGDVLTLSFEGNLDETTSSAAEERIEEALNKAPGNIYFDMSRVQYISSIGIRVLMLAYKKSVKLDKKITLTETSEKVQNVLETVGILPIFTATGNKS